MATEGAELDLYADDIGDEFSQENEYNDSDLYDDVITSNSKSRSAGGGGGGSSGGATGNNTDQEQATTANYNGSSNQSQNSNHSNNSNMLSSHNNTSNNEGSSMNSSKKPCIYVGNLTWWTTDNDVIQALSSIGVNDVAEIKFFENRANGQSKGFCVVTLSLDSSVRNAIEKLPKVELHGQTIAVTMCNRQNLNHFEMKSRKPGQNGQSNNSNQNYNSNQGGMGLSMNNRSYGNQNQSMGTGGGSGRPPLLPGRPGLGGGIGRPNNGPLLNNQPRLPQLPHQSLPFGSSGAQPWTQLMQNGPRNTPLHQSGPSLNPMLRLPQGNSRSLTNQPLLSAPNQDLRTQLSQVGLSGVGQHALNVNALFGSQQSLVNSAGDQFGNRFGGMNPFGGGHPGNDSFGRSGGLDMGLHVSDAEFEEILAKNKTLANNAVSRAVQDATSGDYNSACDTLATAISLISQSRIGHDERCKIIVASLKDTLQGLESKLGHGGHRRERPRSRERSKDRSSSRRDRDKSSRRERSRSRDRGEYRERSRDRHYDDRHYDDRYRKEERDRDRHSERDRRARH